MSLSCSIGFPQLIFDSIFPCHLNLFTWECGVKSIDTLVWRLYLSESMIYLLVMSSPVITLRRTFSSSELEDPSFESLSAAELSFLDFFSFFSFSLRYFLCFLSCLSSFSSSFLLDFSTDLDFFFLLSLLRVLFLSRLGELERLAADVMVSRFSVHCLHVKNFLNINLM